MESLLKPFAFIGQRHSSSPEVKLTDPISFTFASAFLWMFGPPCPRPKSPPAWPALFQAVRRDPMKPAWIVRRAVPDSQDGPHSSPAGPTARSLPATPFAASPWAMEVTDESL